MDQTKSLTPSSEPTAKKKPLTKKNRLFLEHLRQGKGTLEAYYQSGYKGKPHSAYELRSYLKEELFKILEGEGFSRESLVAEINRLNKLPVVNRPLEMKEKLDLLKLQAKLLPQDLKEKPKITPFVFIGQARKEEPKQVIEAEVLEMAQDSITEEKKEEGL